VGRSVGGEYEGTRHCDADVKMRHCDADVKMKVRRQITPPSDEKDDKKT